MARTRRERRQDINRRLEEEMNHTQANESYEKYNHVPPQYRPQEGGNSHQQYSGQGPYQEPPRKKKRRRRGCGCGCWAWILLLILLAVAAIAGKAFYDVRSSVELINTDSNYTQMREQPVSLARGSETANALLLGIDSGESGGVEQGRSDTMVVMAANPKTDTSHMLSIPRDSYVDIPGYGMDKINHAYSYGGADLSVETVQNMLGIPIDYYFAVDMEGLKNVIDALGGITIVPTLSFSQSGYSFQAGVAQEVDGAGALAYSRNRQDDPTGDYGRQERQRQVITSTMDQVSSVEGIANYPSILTALEDSVLTNASLGEMLTGFVNYRSAASNVDQFQLTGSGQMINGIYYEIIPDDQLIQAQAFLQEKI